MKLVRYLVVGIAIPGIGLSQTSQTKITERSTRVLRTSNRIQVQLEVEPITIQPGATVLARIKAKNVSSKSVRLQDSFPENDFRVVLTDATGACGGTAGGPSTEYDPGHTIWIYLDLTNETSEKALCS